MTQVNQAGRGGQPGFVLAFIWLLSGLGGGCTMIDSTLTLSYTPAMEPIVSTPFSVFLARVSDQRPDRNRIGCKKNGVGGESADLFLDVSLTDWFGGVINEEFKRSGLNLAQPADPKAVRVEVDLLNFFIEPDIGFMQPYHVYAVISAEVTVRFPSGSGYARRFAAKADDTFLLPTDGSYVKVMDRAMINWITQAVPDIVRLIQGRASLSVVSLTAASRRAR